MFTSLLRASAEVGPSAIWITKFCAAVVAAFVLYVGIAIWATLRAPNSDQQQVCYQILHDLLDIFRDFLDLFRRGRGR